MAPQATRSYCYTEHIYGGEGMWVTLIILSSFLILDKSPGSSEDSDHPDFRTLGLYHNSSDISGHAADYKVYTTRQYPCRNVSHV